MIGARWTPEDDELLRREDAEGVPYGIIAHHLGRSRTAVMQRGRIIGLDYRRRPWTGPEKRRLKAEIESGVRYREIAASHGRTVVAIHVQACLLGLTKPKRANA